MKHAAGLLLAVSGLVLGCEEPADGGGQQFAPYDGGPRDSASLDSPDAAPPVDFVPPNTLTVATYNVENLFDLVDDPNADEGEFTPGRPTWDANRLARRLTDLADAFTAIAADVVLVNEVENLDVLTQLRDAIRAGGGPVYPYMAIAPSRDPRGIDVSLLSRYPVLLQLGRPINRAHTCTHVETGEQTTLDGAWPEARPILQVELNLDADPEADLVLLGNHWKAKGRGSFPCDDEAHRLRSALHLRALIETLTAARPEVGLVALGDFNTWDFEPPLAQALDARLDLDAQALIFNAWGDAGVLERNTRNDNDWNRSTNSTYQFDGVWSRLDHILLSNTVLDGRSGWRLVAGSVESVAEPRFLGPGGAPRSWSPETGAGYSDHLPVRLTLTRVPQATGAQAE